MKLLKIVALMAFLPSTLIFAQNEEMVMMLAEESQVEPVELRTIGGSALPKEFKDLQEKRAALEDTRYIKINAPMEEAKDHIDFWSHQLSEHALFLHLGIEDKDLKEKALALHNKFEAFRNTMNEETVSMEQMEKVLPLIKELRDYKVEVLESLLAGKWIGWIFALFARHIILESDYFVDKLQQIPYTDREEIAFWNIINGEHAGFAAHLLDPSERALSKKANKLSRKFARLVTSEDEMMQQISLHAAKALDKYNQAAEAGIAANKVASVIHPALINHVVREGQRSIKVLSSLQNQEGAIYPSAQGSQE